MKRKLALMLLCTVMTITAWAQSAITGTVVSAVDGEPIIGATVKVKGASQGTVTDMNGKFTVNVQAGKTLVVSYIGMQSKEAAAKNGMTVALGEDDTMLDDVIVVAYGTQKKSSFTGSAATVKGDKLEKMQVSNVGKALEGAVAGVQISSGSGTPGSAASIRIRGIGSISSSQEPLIVVDGVPYEGSLNSIPTHDIESMTILKDAAANSMYGARGSNGVIMITTKSGKSGKININLDARVGWNSRGVSNYDIISDAGEYYEMFYESVKNQLTPSMGVAGASDYAAKHLIDGYLKYNKFKGVADDQLIDPTTGKLNPNAKDYKWTDDWTKDPFQTATRQEYNLTLSGGTDWTKAYASFGYLDDIGMVPGSGFDRVNARVKIEQKLRNNIRIGGNLAYALTNYKTFGNEESNYSNLFMFSQQIAPIYPIYFYDKDGNPAKNSAGSIYDFGTEYTRPYASEQNPLATAEANINQTKRDNISTRGFFEWSFLKDFTFTANVAYDVFNSYKTQFMTPIGGDAYSVGGRGYKTYSRYGALNVNELLDWNHEFGKHGVHVLLGHENKNDYSMSMYGHMTQYSDVTNPEFSNAAQYQDLDSSTSEYALEGFFAKGEYNYADKYYFTASIRRDGSSRFHKDNRWGTFWAIGGSWRLKEESFLKDVNWLNNLKLKASYGTQGNDYTPWTHMYSDLYSVNRVDGAAAFSKVLRGNPDLTWEKSANFNVGVEASFWNRLNFGAEFFIKETKDMLYQSPLASSEGNPSYIWRNEMNMKNTGFEVEVDGDIIKNKTITWNVGLNLTHYKNELTRLPDSKPADKYPNGYQAGAYWRKLGGSLYDFYRYEYVGVDPENGLPQYNKYIYKTDKETGETLRDADGNEIVDKIEIVNKTSEATLRQIGKSAIPDLTGGFSTSLQAYGFDFSAAFAFQLGGYVIDSFYSALMSCGDQGHNFHKDMFNRWTPANTNTTVPALCYASQSAGIDGASDYFLTSASYLSLRNITLGYTLPRSVLKTIGLSTVRVYCAADNLFLLSARKGLDPRQSFSGSTGYVYNALRTVSVGLNVGF